MNLLALVLALQTPGSQQGVLPVLSFPEPGLDDSAAYAGYATRFYRDAAGNVLQIYIQGSSGRVVHLWADAANESLAFTARAADRRAVAPVWAGAEARIGIDGEQRWVEHELALPAEIVDLGWFQLGSMRVERDFQYQDGHLRPFTAAPFRVHEFTTLVDDVARLGPPERDRHLRILGVDDVAALRARLDPTFERIGAGAVRVTQPALDGRHLLRLELRVDSASASVEIGGAIVRVVPRNAEAVTLRVLVATDADALTPLYRDDIFNDDFRSFFERARAAHDSASRAGAPGDHPRILQFRRMERQVRGIELVSTREKLMAGLPNFATYFGRDDMLTALLMQPVWTPAMQEAVIAAVLRKLAPTGEVSHEESLGGQAIRENASTYHDLVSLALEKRSAGDVAAADSAFTRARATLETLDATRENYRMVDDELQLPVLVARYLDNAAASPERKRAFLDEPAGAGNETRLAALLRALAYVAGIAEPYADDPIATNLIGFPRLPDGHWMSASWRDSGVGYAGGRFAMDVNAIWAPEALRSIGSIGAALRSLGYDVSTMLDAATPTPAGPLARYHRDPSALEQAIETWNGAARHFDVALSPDDARARVAARLEQLQPEAREYWARIAAAHQPDTTVRFTTLALDSAGAPISVVSTDPAMWLLLGDVAGAIERAELTPQAALADLNTMMLRYPFGLLVDSLGPLVANDAYAAPHVWQAWMADAYHSPRVVWGREVNVLLAGLAHQILAARGDACRARTPALETFVSEAHGMIDRITSAVDASGLAHNELWTYRIESGRLRPVRFATSSDVQLWNLTDLAVQFQLDRLARCTTDR